MSKARIQAVRPAGGEVSGGGAAGRCHGSDGPLRPWRFADQYRRQPTCFDGRLGLLVAEHLNLIAQDSQHTDHPRIGSGVPLKLINQTLRLHESVEVEIGCSHTGTLALVNVQFDIAHIQEAEAEVYIAKHQLLLGSIRVRKCAQARAEGSNLQARLQAHPAPQPVEQKTPGLTRLSFVSHSLLVELSTVVVHRTIGESRVLSTLLSTGRVAGVRTRA